MNEVRDCKIVLVGESASGKTSLVTRLVSNTFDVNNGVTIGSQYSTKIIKSTEGKTNIKLGFWDTAGRERYFALAPMFYRGANGVIIVFDLTRRETFWRANAWIKEADKNTAAKKILIGNKSDLADQRQVSSEEAKEFADHLGIPYIETSAKEGLNINTAIEVLVQELEKSLDNPDAAQVKRAEVNSPPKRSYCTIL